MTTRGEAEPGSEGDPNTIVASQWPGTGEATGRAELHLHTGCSFLDGASSLEDLVARAADDCGSVV